MEYVITFWTCDHIFIYKILQLLNWNKIFMYPYLNYVILLSYQIIVVKIFQEAKIKLLTSNYTRKYMYNNNNLSRYIYSDFIVL